MADPTPYERSYSFRSFQDAEENARQLGQRLDVEFDKVSGKTVELVQAVTEFTTQTPLTGDPGTPVAVVNGRLRIPRGEPGLQGDKGDPGLGVDPTALYQAVDRAETSAREAGDEAQRVAGMAPDIAQARQDATNALTASTPVGSYAAALVAAQIPFLDRVSAIINGQMVEWVRRPGGPCLGGGWAPADVVTPQHFGALGDFDYSAKSGNDDTAAFRAAFATGNRVFVPKADYRITGEMEITTPGQVIEFETSGGYAYGENIGALWQAGGTRLVATGTFAKRIRTRRRWRGSAADPQDAPLSVVLNIQAEGVELIRPSIALWCDYSDASQANLGDNCDVGIFIGTRVGVQLKDPQVIGYFRRAGILNDVSGHTDLPRFPSLSGAEYPAGTVKNGSDGLHIWNPHIRGPRVGFTVLGAAPKPGQSGYSDPYYDEILGATVTDRRGSFGSSDMEVFGGRIYGPDHHSNRRLKDPVLVNGALSEASLAAEPDDAPAAVHIDGLAGNSSSNVWGMRFIGTRIATFEAFRVRLGKASRISFFGAHIEGRGSSSRRMTTGDPVNSNDYTVASYGDISGTALTDRVTVFGTPRPDYRNLAPHFYGPKPYVVTDYGNVLMGAGSTVFDAEGDYRAGTGHRWRTGNVSLATLNEAEFRLFGQRVRFGSGPTISAGEGSPEGVVSAPLGSLYLRTDGDTGTCLYVKQPGEGAAGWVAK